MNNLAKVACRTLIRNTILSQPNTSVSSAVCLFSSKSELIDAAKAAKAAEAKPKTTPSPKITLIAKDESVSIVSLVEAQKLAKRRDLKLVKILDLDTKTKRAIYK
jgi:translation initiation factor IF-3